VRVDSVIATSTAIFEDEIGVIKHIIWNAATNGHMLKLEDKDGNIVFRYTASTGLLSPYFPNIDLPFNGLYISDLDGGELHIYIKTLSPKPSELKV